MAPGVVSKMCHAGMGLCFSYQSGITRQVYTVIGVFAAARYGLGTAGNVLVNTWLGGIPEGVLDLAVGAYLSISIPPILARWPRRTADLHVTMQ